MSRHEKPSDKRERSYNNELPYFLRASPSNMIGGGDFNCVLNQTDSTRHFNYSKTLDGLGGGFELQDMWLAEPLRTVFTHYFPMDASRIDRIYTTKEQGNKKTCVETGSFHRPPISGNAALRRCPHRATGHGILENEHFHS